MADAPRTAGWVLHGAHSYDLFGWLMSLGRYKAMRRKLIEIAAFQSSDRVLDVGCGTGTLALEIEPAVGTGEVHGIDASPEMIAVARQKAAKAGLPVDFQVALIEAIPFADASFDVVTATLMLHHLPDDLKRQGLAEIRRVLKPGGRLLVVDFAAEHDHPPAGPARMVWHLITVLGRTHGPSAAAKLLPMIRDAGFQEADTIATPYQHFVFLRAV